jgi:hypothetical protein
MKTKLAVRGLAMTAVLWTAFAGLVAQPAMAERSAAVSTRNSGDPTAERDRWREVMDLGNRDLCRVAGRAGEGLNLWDDDEWRCIGGTLYVRR